MVVGQCGFVGGSLGLVSVWVGSLALIHEGGCGCVCGGS